MAFDRIDYTLEDNIALVRLHHEKSLNALSREMAAELLEAVERSQIEARVLIIGSHGRAFSSGANLAEGGFDLDDPHRDVGWGLEKFMNPLVRALRDMEIPLITAVRGPAIGIGCSVALMGDIIVAAESAYFWQSFRHVGLVPDGGAAYLLSKSIGRVRAMELMLLGKKFAAGEALEAGLVTRLVADDELDLTVNTIARELAAAPTLALAMIRRAAWAALDSTLEQQLVLDRNMQRRAGQTEDFIEGVTAFREKRSPVFRGR